MRIMRFAELESYPLIIVIKNAMFKKASSSQSDDNRECEGLKFIVGRQSKLWSPHYTLEAIGNIVPSTPAVVEPSKCF